MSKVTREPEDGYKSGVFNDFDVNGGYAYRDGGEVIGYAVDITYKLSKTRKVHVHDADVNLIKVLPNMVKADALMGLSD